MSTVIADNTSTAERGITHVAIAPWPDAVIDTVGLDPRSSYVETYWLGILGPSTTWLLRRLVTGLERSPDGFELPLAETARCLGLGDKGGRNSPFMRAMTRLVQFNLAISQDETTMAVRRKVPALTKRQAARLPESLQQTHANWQDTRTPAAAVAAAEARQRARSLALTIFEMGEDIEASEHQLLQWKFHPAIAHEAAVWGWEAHQARQAQTSE